MDIGILGCGNMGSAFASHFLKEHTLFVYDKNPEKAKATGGTVMPSAKELAASVDLLLLAIKPQQLHEVGEEIETAIGKETIIASILVGTTLESLQDRFSSGTVVRMMPNLPITCGKGVIAIAEPAPQILSEILGGLGLIKYVPEKHMDAIGAIAGSGPAYMFLVIEALVEAGITMGLTSHDSLEYALQTMDGAAALLKERKIVPEELKWEITSPGGTTIAALVEMEEAGVKAGIISGALAAFRKSRSFT